MECINAEWEVRNLGVRTIEISVEKKDLELTEEKFLQMIEDYRRQYDAKYVVVKSDTRYPELSFYLQKAGYWLIENQIDLTFNREDAIKSWEKYENLFPEVSYRPATDDDMQIIFEELKRGMFKTDRIALDPYFGLEIANRRYAFWIKDAVERGANVCTCLNKNEPVGFFVFTLKGKKSVALLGGVFDKTELSHLGSMQVYGGLKCMCECDCSSEKTAVSSNNLNMLQLHLMFGRKIKRIKNVFVKHFD